MTVTSRNNIFSVWFKFHATLLVLFIFTSGKAHSQSVQLTEKKIFEGYSEYVNEAIFSPYRNFFALTTGSNTLQLYNSDWSLIYEYHGNPELRGGRVVFSPDEKWMIFSRYKSETDIAVYDLHLKKVVDILADHSNFVNDLVLSVDGKYLFTVSTDNTLNIYQANRDKFSLVQTISDHTGSVTSVSASASGKFVATASNDKSVKIYSLVNDQFTLFQSIDDYSYYPTDVAFRPEHNEVLIATGYSVELFRLKQKQFVRFDSLETKIKVNNDVSWSPQGEAFVLGEYSKLNIYTVSDEKIVHTESSFRHGDYVFSGKFSDDGRFLTSYGSDKTAIIWELQGIKPSNRTLISDYMDNELTYSQLQVLNPEVINNLLNSTRKELTLPKGEFETTAEYLSRKAMLKDHVLSELQKAQENYYKVRSRDGYISAGIDYLIGYNADLQIYKANAFDSEMGIKVPVEEARSLKENWKNAEIVVNKTIKNNQLSYKYNNFRLKHPKSGKYYEIEFLENPFEKEDITGSRQPQKIIGLMPGAEKDEGADVQGMNYALHFASNVYEIFPDLINPVYDANTIHQELADNYGFNTVVHENPTLDQLVSVIRDYAQIDYNPADHLFIFIAGHGVYDDIFKEGYIITKDSKAGDVAKTSYLSHSNLRTMINNIPCNHIFLVMDVCFGGTFDPLIASRSRSLDMYNDIETNEFIQRKIKYKTRLYLTSGGKEYVPDGRPGHHSPFARKLIEALRSYGGEDKVLTTNEIIQYIDKVNPQPCFGEFGDNEPGSDFLFIAR